MIKVITYGTFDFLHFGHINLLRRAKALGDYLVVAITSDSFDKQRGKINVRQPLFERINAVKSLGIADEIIVEEYVGQKIDDIIKYGIDIFAIGSDWAGKFDYLEEYCKVVYLPRTVGISSTDVREENNKLKIGYIGNSSILSKFYNETAYINGLKASLVLTDDREYIKLNAVDKNITFANSVDECIKNSDAVYIVSAPENNYSTVKHLLEKGISVISESPICLSVAQFDDLVAEAESKKVKLFDSIKTAYSTAYHRLILFAKSGIIGDIVSVDATCTSLSSSYAEEENAKWGSIYAWGPTALLPVFQLLGIKYKKKDIKTSYQDGERTNDKFTSINFTYEKAIANIKVGRGVKSEGQLIISGTKGCIFVPAPWWKTDYFEVHYEDANRNRRYYYELNGEGIREMLLNFYDSVAFNKKSCMISTEVSRAIIKVIEDWKNKIDVTEI